MASEIASQSKSQPISNLKALDRLVGSWRISGGSHGQIRFEWLEGGLFLMQHVELEFGPRKIKGVEIIGHLRQPGADASPEIHSRFYSFLDGLTLDYVYELSDDTLRIWFGPKGSDNHFIGHFAPDRNSFHGSWKWPSGGYEVVATRIA